MPGVASPERLLQKLSHQKVGIGVRDLLGWLRGIACGAAESGGSLLDVPFDLICDQYFPCPTTVREKPVVVIVSPYVVFPPTHGGAVRMQQFIRALTPVFQVHLLSDEREFYSIESCTQFEGLASVFLVDGRPLSFDGSPSRVARVRSHSNEALERALRMLLGMYRPFAVEIEYVELSQLVRCRGDRGEIWVLNLHDVLLSGAPQESMSEEDRFETEWMGRFDYLMTCCEEDRDLLRQASALVVPNGFDQSVLPQYLPSEDNRKMLFVGPFRTPLNLSGIREFLATVYPRLELEFDDIELTVVGGRGCAQVVRDDPSFCRPGIRLLEYVPDLFGLMRESALTINPIGPNRGTCLKLVESLASGRVCVSTREGARGFLKEGFPGLVTSETIAGMFDPICRLLHDVGHRRMIEKPPPELWQRYSHHSIGEQIRDWYSARWTA